VNGFFAPLALGFAIAISATPAVAARRFDTSKIEQITGLKGAYSEKEDVFKVSSPRSDAKVEVDGWAMPPFMGLTSWAAFARGRANQAMLMGDLVLFEDEVNPAMSAALDSGLSVTALHNHFFFDAPKVYFMHIGGEGDEEKLATGVRNVFDKVKQIRATNPQPAAKFAGPPIPAQSSLSAGALEDILGVKGQVNDGMFKAVWGLSTQMHGMQMGSEMGVNTWAAFAGSDDNAVVDGDFAMRENELQPVLRSMRREGINVVAIHSHMAGENPRILFLHYWGRGKTEDLARALRRTLDVQRAASGAARHMEIHQGKADTAPWDSPEKGGAQAAWERAIQARSANQNEYARMR
jgi:hypothetical protein